jgi:pimeloyl-ACP methyl ester carboxylesterase
MERMQTVRIGRHDIAFFDDGSGQPLVLLPGFQSNAGRWRGFGYHDALPGRRIIAVDPLGHGNSSRSTEASEYSADQVVAHVVGVLDELHIERAAIMGFSRGGAIAALCCELAPERCSAVVIGASPLGSAQDVTHPLLLKGVAALQADDWNAYWSGYPIPLPDPIKDYLQSTNDAPSNAAAIEAMVGWRKEYPRFGLEPTAVPRLAYFGTGEIFADALRAELEAHRVEYVEADWAGHADTMADARGVAQIVLPFLELHSA